MHDKCIKPRKGKGNQRNRRPRNIKNCEKSEIKMIAREASNCVEQLLIDEASKAAIDRVIGNAQTTILVMKDAAQQLRDNQHLQQLEMLKAKR